MNPSFPAPAVGNHVADLGATVAITSGANIFLTPSSLGLQVISMTALGRSVFLPPSYALVPGQSKLGIKNNGGYVFGVRDSTGNLLTALGPSGYAMFALDNNGNWAFTGAGLEPGMVTIDTLFSSTFTTTPLYGPYAALDANTSIHILALSSGFAAIVVDNLGKVISTPVTVTAAAETPVQMFKVSTTSVILFYGTNGNTQRAVILTLTGTTPTLSLSVGTPQTLTTGAAGNFYDQENSQGAPKICQLTSTLYVAAIPDLTTALKVVAFSVSGATITLGATATVIASNFSFNSALLYTLTSTTAFLIYKAAASAPFTTNGVVISVAGTVCTVNTPTALTGVGSTAVGASSAVQLSASKFIVADDSGGSSGAVVVGAYTIAGVVVTAGAALTIETGLTATTTPLFTASSATRFNPHLWLVSTGSTNVAGFWYYDATGGNSRVVVLSETGGTITAGAITYNSVSSNTASTAGNGNMLPQTTTEFVALRMQMSAASGYGLFVVANKITGTSNTWGQTKPLRNIAQNTLATCNKLPSGDYVITGNVGNGLDVATVIRNNGDTLNYRGDITMPNFQNQTIIYQGGMIPSNRVVLIGITTNSGSTISGTVYQIRILNIEVAV